MKGKCLTPEQLEAAINILRMNPKIQGLITQIIAKEYGLEMLKNIKKEDRKKKLPDLPRFNGMCP